MRPDNLMIEAVLLALNHSITDHASPSIWSTFPTPNEDRFDIGELTFTFPIQYTRIFYISYPLPISPSIATIYLPSWSDRFFWYSDVVNYQLNLCIHIEISVVQ